MVHGLGVLREKRRKPDAGARRNDIAEVPDGIVVKPRLRDGDCLALRRIHERKVECLLAVRPELGGVGELGNRLLAAERRARSAVELAARGRRQRQVRLFACDDAGALQLEAVRHAVAARHDADGEVAEVHELLLTTQVDFGLLVYRRRHLAFRSRDDCDLANRRALRQALAVQAYPYFRGRDEDLAVSQHLVRKRV